MKKSEWKKNNRNKQCIPGIPPGGFLLLMELILFFSCRLSKLNGIPRIPFCYHFITNQPTKHDLNEYEYDGITDWHLKPIFNLQMSTRRGSTEVHELYGDFLGYHAYYKVTSVIGHVFRSLSFIPWYYV